MSEAEGNFNQPKDYYQYRKDVNDKVKPYGERLVGERNYNLLKFIAIGVGIFCIVLLLLVYKGYTKDDIKLECAECQKCPDFPTITIPECPETPCTCSPILNCGDFPSELNLNLTG